VSLPLRPPLPPKPAIRTSKPCQMSLERPQSPLRKKLSRCATHYDVISKADKLSDKQSGSLTRRVTDSWTPTTPCSKLSVIQKTGTDLARQRLCAGARARQVRRRRSQERPLTPWPSQQKKQTKKKRSFECCCEVQALRSAHSPDGSAPTSSGRVLGEFSASSGRMLDEC
jgi:hypothetical protein